jgi:hypothetical protein
MLRVICVVTRRCRRPVVFRVPSHVLQWASSSAPSPHSRVHSLTPATALLRSLVFALRAYISAERQPGLVKRHVVVLFRFSPARRGESAQKKKKKKKRPNRSHMWRNNHARNAGGHLGQMTPRAAHRSVRYATAAAFIEVNRTQIVTGVLDGDSWLVADNGSVAHPAAPPHPSACRLLVLRALPQESDAPLILAPAVLVEPAYTRQRYGAIDSDDEEMAWSKCEFRTRRTAPRIANSSGTSKMLSTPALRRSPHLRHQARCRQ